MSPSPLALISGSHLLSKAGEASWAMVTSPVSVYRNSPLYPHYHYGLWILLLKYHWKLTEVHSTLRLLTLPDILDDSGFCKSPRSPTPIPVTRKYPVFREKATTSNMVQTNHVSKQLCFKHNTPHF